MSDIRNYFKKAPTINKKRTREQADEDEHTFVPKSIGKVVKPTKTNIPITPPKKMKTTEIDPIEKKNRSERYKSFINRGGPTAPGSKTIPDGEENCLQNLTFVISGVLESLERDECKNLVEKYGGRVTTGISGKTNYLIAGRDCSEGKLNKAKEIKLEIISEDGLLELILTRPGTKVSTTTPKLKRKSSSIIDLDPIIIPKTSDEDSSLLWVDKYKPQTIKNLIGQQGEKSCVQKLVAWLRDWYKHHDHSDEKVKAKSSFGFNRNEDPAMFKAALLSGPPGIGKTTAAQLVCQHLNFEYIEKNASDQRSKKSMSILSNDTYSIAHFSNKSSSSMMKYVLIMDEVDGVSGNNDRGGIQELISIIKQSRIPIICICNDRQHKKIRSLANYCYDLRFHRPNIQQIRSAMLTILHRENIHNLKQEVLDEIIQSCNQDIRQIINSLNLWSIQGIHTNSSAAKMIEKNINTNPFELCRLSFSDEFRTKSLSDKSDIFFSDYQLMPLLIQENYLQCQPHKKQLTDIEHLNLISKSADSISLGDICSQMIFSRNESWSLLPYQAIFSTVAPCSYVRGHLRGMVNFSSFFGQRSRRNKNERLLNEIEKHICLKTRSANKQEFNLDYLPYLSRILISPLNENNIEICISLLDDYYLNREDFQVIMEINTWNKLNKNLYEQLDTKVKALLTRTYNKKIHRTPYAIIDIKKLKKLKDIIDEDEEEEEEEEEMANSISINPSSSPLMKYVSLVLLTLQNVASILLLRYVRTTSGPRFINSTAVFNSEIQKTIFSILFLIYEERSIVTSFKLIYDKVIRHSKDTFKTGIPAFLYTLQNNLLFVSISNLDAATFQVSFQLKIFTTAIFTVLILRRPLNLVQWLALFLLFFGISLVQLENMTSTTPKQDVNAVFGLISVVSACILSGLAGVYFEKILKGSDVSVWIRNIQLGIFGMLFGYLTMYFWDGTEIKTQGFFFGYTNMVWVAITVQSAGGILVALVIKYSDNIMKGFATSLAIIIACIISMMLFDFQLTILFTLGTSLVIFAIFIYLKPDLILKVPIFNIVFQDRSVLL